MSFLGRPGKTKKRIFKLPPLSQVELQETDNDSRFQARES